jgi:hypothetical protein
VVDGDLMCEWNAQRFKGQPLPQGLRVEAAGQINAFLLPSDLPSKQAPVLSAKSIQFLFLK